MRQVTATEKYRAVNEGSMAQSEFVRQMKLAFPQFISPANGYDDTVQILKNYNLLHESKEAKEAADVSKYSDDSLKRAIDIELEAMGLMSQETISGEDQTKAKTKAVKNLKKDPLHYYNLIAGESSKVSKNDKEVEVKRGEAKQDVFNSMKKAELKEDKENLKESSQEQSVADYIIKHFTNPKTGESFVDDDMVSDFYKTHPEWEKMADGTEEGMKDLIFAFNEFLNANFDSVDEKMANTVDDVIDPADYGLIGQGYLKGFNKPHSLNADDLETLGRKVVDSLYKGDFDKAKAKFVDELAGYTRRGEKEIESEPSRFKGRDKSRLRGMKEDLDADFAPSPNSNVMDANAEEYDVATAFKKAGVDMSKPVMVIHSYGHAQYASSDKDEMSAQAAIKKLEAERQDRSKQYTDDGMEVPEDHHGYEFENYSILEEEMPEGHEYKFAYFQTGDNDYAITQEKSGVNEKMSDEFMDQVKNYGKDNTFNAKPYEPGDHWTEEFDYAGMLKAALKIRINTPLSMMQKIYDSFEDVNYHRENVHLNAAMDALKNGNKQEASEYLKDHKKEIALTVRQMSESTDRNFVREGYYGESNMEQIAGALGYDSLDEFLNDNPGATEGMIEWIGSVPEFRAKLSKEYSSSELENMGFYNIPGYDSEEDLDEKKVNEEEGKYSWEYDDQGYGALEAFFDDIVHKVGPEISLEDAKSLLDSRGEGGDDTKAFNQAAITQMQATDDDDMDKKSTQNMIQAYEEKYNEPFSTNLIKHLDSVLFEKKGKDHDGDGDIDGDDYMASKDKAIKKAMGKDEQLVKENLKSIITKVLEEKTINEAATAKLADWGKGYEAFPGVKPVVIELENIVTEIEQFYDKIGDKIAKTFSKTGDFRNEEGLKIGAFISPSLEAAFKQDLRPVVKGGFTKKIELPKVRTITQADIDRGSVAETEVEEEKETVFSPPAVNGTLRENKKK